jgi:Na+/H+ antiporter NhaD/arsenite permease-like protein
MISITLFILCYLGFMVWPDKKSAIAFAGALLLILTGTLSAPEAFWAVHWNVMGLFVGTLALAELFMYSRVPAVIAEGLVNRAGSVRGALMGLFALTSVISMFVENVAVVLVIAPVALSLCKKLELNPIKPLILLAMFSNLQGAATLIGDPPSMLLASFMKLSFMDFFFYEGKPGLFFVTQVGAIFAFLFTYYLFRHENRKVTLVRVEKVISWIPTWLLLALIFILAAGSSFDTEAEWLAGVTAMGLALIGMVWHHFGPKWHRTEKILTDLDWKSALFLFSLFILLFALKQEGWMDTMAHFMAQHLPNDVIGVYFILIAVSLVLSAFIDNIPFLIAMIPIVQELSVEKGFPLPLLAFGLLVGTSLGGNITPIGASANIVAVSFLEKNGHNISFLSYMKIGILFTLCATVPAALFLLKQYYY